MAASKSIKSTDRGHLQLALPFLDLTAPDPVLAALTRDLAALRRENAALRRKVSRLSRFKKLSLTDPLTGLHNRRYFEQRVSEEISRAARVGHGLSLLLVDLDDFKAINDEHGHTRGDLALRWVADFLLDNTRRHDVCCRLGGDEFVVILSGAGVEECQQMVERLQQRFEAEQEQAELPLRWSIGTATHGEGCDTAEALFDMADAAMYREKQRRKRPAA